MPSNAVRRFAFQAVALICIFLLIGSFYFFSPADTSANVIVRLMEGSENNVRLATTYGTMTVRSGGETKTYSGDESVLIPLSVSDDTFSLKDGVEIDAFCYVTIEPDFWVADKFEKFHYIRGVWEGGGFPVPAVQIDGHVKITLETTSGTTIKVLKHRLIDVNEYACTNNEWFASLYLIFPTMGMIIDDPILMTGDKVKVGIRHDIFRLEDFNISQAMGQTDLDDGEYIIRMEISQVWSGSVVVLPTSDLFWSTVSAMGVISPQTVAELIQDNYYPDIIQGSADPIIPTFTVLVEDGHVLKDDFGIDFTADDGTDTLTVGRKDVGVQTGTISLLAGEEFSRDVELAIFGTIPDGATYEFSLNPVPMTPLTFSSSRLSFEATPDTLEGDYDLVISGQGSMQRIHAVPFLLRVVEHEEGEGSVVTYIELDVEDDTLTPDEDFTVDGKLLTAADEPIIGATIEFTTDWGFVRELITESRGKFEVDLTAPEEIDDNYHIRAQYFGDDKYKATEEEITIDVAEPTPFDLLIEMLDRFFAMKYWWLLVLILFFIILLLMFAPRR